MQLLKDERPELKDSRLDFLLNSSYMYQGNIPFILFLSHATEKIIEKSLEKKLWWEPS